MEGVIVKCSDCKRLQHQSCIRDNSDTGEMISPYLCPQCQLVKLDPLSLPILAVAKPFKVQNLKGTLKEKLSMLKFCKKDFEFNKLQSAYLR
jgi:hypothetical protein